jgi:hypothetical protein
MKKCNCCKKEKEFIYFSKDKNKKFGYDDRCKMCSKEYYIKNKVDRINKQKEYYKSNVEKIKEYGKEYYISKIEQKKEYSRNYSKNNREKINKYLRTYNKERCKNDYLFKLKKNIRSLISISIRKQGFSKQSKTFEYLGCTFEDFKIHLESKFVTGMSWDNRGKWHIDHIYPISLAKTKEDVIKLNHYTNFQPLWAEDNLRKGNKILNG